MAKLVNWHGFETRLKGKGILLFTATDICRLFGVSRVATTFLLHRYAQKGFILRVKRGFYAFPDALPPEPYIANRIYSPSYLSMEFALSYHGVTPETVYELTSVTSKSPRRFEVLKKFYVYRHIRREAYTGYDTVKQGNFSFFIADAEKAFIDANYFRMFDKLKLLSRFDREKINSEKTLSYAKLFGNAKFLKMIQEALSR